MHRTIAHLGPLYRKFKSKPAEIGVRDIRFIIRELAKVGQRLEALGPEHTFGCKAIRQDIRELEDLLITKGRTPVGDEDNHWPN